MRFPDVGKTSESKTVCLVADWEIRKSQERNRKQRTRSAETQ